MRIMRLLTPIFLAVSAAAAAPAPIEAYLTQAQASLAEIDRVLEAVGSSEGRAETACRESFTAGALLEGLRNGQLPVAAFAVLQPLREGLTAYLSCKALAADDPSVCRGLEPLASLAAGSKPALPPHYICRRDYQTWAYDLARIAASPDLLRRCRDENVYRWPGDEGPFRPGTEETVCRLVADYSAKRLSVAQTCAGLSPHFTSPVPPEECARRVRWFFGEDEALCADLRSEVVRARCRDIAATRKAHAAGRYRPPDCAPPLASARAAYCGRYSLDYAWRLHADLSVLLDRAAELLAGASQGQGEPAARLARLEARRQDLVRALGRDASPEMGTLGLPGAAFAAVDLELAAAHALVLSREPGEPVAGCKEGFSLSSLLAEIGSGRLRPDEELRKQLEGYFGCLALVLDGPGVCAALDLPALKAAHAYSPDYRCRHNYLMWNSDLARISGRPDAPARCIAENYYRWRDPFDGGPFKPGAFREGCGLLLDYSVRGQDLRQACGKVMPYFRYSTDVGECVKRFQYAHGEDARLCYSLEKPRPKLDRCLDLVALHGAVRDGKPCGESAYCRMQLERGPQSCGPYLAGLRRSSCKSGATGAGAKDPGQVAGSLEQASRHLEALEGGSPDERERRRSFIAWLRRRLSR